MVATKTCTRCRGEKPLDAFRRGQGYKDGIRAECKACEAERLRLWREAHPEQRREQWERNNRSRRARGVGVYDPDPEKREIFAMQDRDTYLRRTYGISLGDYIELRERQGGVCAICRQVPTKVVGPPRTRQAHHPELVVDHDHATGRVRGLLCNNCNISLAHARDDAAILSAMIEYLSSALPTDR